jgi:hypothetical protein
MVEKDALPGRNVIDFLGYQQGRKSVRKISSKAHPLTVRSCMHCGAALMDGESEDDCSSAGVSLEVVTRKFYAEP